jgi:DNA processing protein
MGYDPCSLDALCTGTGLGADAVAAALLELELGGLVEGLPGGQYQRTR